MFLGIIGINHIYHSYGHSVTMAIREKTLITPFFEVISSSYLVSRFPETIDSAIYLVAMNN